MKQLTKIIFVLLISNSLAIASPMFSYMSGRGSKNSKGQQQVQNDLSRYQEAAATEYDMRRDLGKSKTCTQEMIDIFKVRSYYRSSKEGSVLRKLLFFVKELKSIFSLEVENTINSMIKFAEVEPAMHGVEEKMKEYENIMSTLSNADDSEEWLEIRENLQRRVESLSSDTRKQFFMEADEFNKFLKGLLEREAAQAFEKEQTLKLSTLAKSIYDSWVKQMKELKDLKLIYKKIYEEEEAKLPEDDYSTIEFPEIENNPEYQRILRRLHFLKQRGLYLNAFNSFIA